jgi:hypothetical protein
VREEEAHGVVTASAGRPGVPRAVFSGCISASPGGVTKPSFWERPFYPPLTGSHTGCAVFGIRAPQTRRPLWRLVKTPGTAAFSRREALRAPRHRSRPANRTRLQDLPLVRRDELNIILLSREST